MIWGDFINQIRSLHLELMEQFSIQPAQFTADIELQSSGFPFPETGEDFGDWDPPAQPDRIQEALEFHPVERAMVEGPLLPIQEVIVKKEDWERLYQAILGLEKEWLVKSKISNPEASAFVEQNLKAKFLQLQRRSGNFGLKAI